MGSPKSSTPSTLTTTIKREWLREIIAGRKRVEYRELKPYWTNRLARHAPPFRLRLINGMAKNAPEVTVVVTRVTTNRRSKEYELRLGAIVEVRHWDRRREAPMRLASRN